MIGNSPPLRRTLIAFTVSISTSFSAVWAQGPTCVDYPQRVSFIPDDIGYPIYGAARMAVAGSRLYVVGGDLRVFDVSTPRRPSFLGSAATPGNAQDVVVQGKLAYVADSTGGLQIIDVADPASPRIVGAMTTATAARCVAVSASYAYLGDAHAGLVTVDVSDSSNPIAVGAIGVAGTPSALALAGSHAYLAVEGFGLLVFDVSSPAQPTVIGAAPTSRPAHGVAVAGDYAYVAADSAGLLIVDVSDPARPRVVGTADTPGAARDVFVDGESAGAARGGARPGHAAGAIPAISRSAPFDARYAYVADGSAGLQLIDVSAPASPRPLSSVRTDAPARGVAVAGGIVYVATTGAALAIDVFAPPPPIRGSVAVHGTHPTLAASGDDCYVLDDAGLEVIHVPASGAPRIVGSTNPPGDAHAIAVAGGLACMIADSTLQVLDVHDPARPALTGSASFALGTYGTLRNVAIAGHFALVTGAYYDLGRSGSLIVADISDPSMPFYVTRMSTGTGGEVIVAGSYAYMTYFSGNGGWGGILAVDISDPRHPFSTWSEGGYQFASPTWSGSYLCASISHRVKVYGLSDPAHPAGLGDLGSTTLSPPVALAGHFLYFQTGTTAPGLELVDITDPTVPTVAGNLELPRPGSMIALTSRWVFVSDSSEVLVAYRQCDDAAVGADVTAPLTRSLTFEACAPNPFRGATRIAYALPSAAPVRLDVYDVAGRHVRTLVREAAAVAGRHMTSWDGSADGGRPASAGVYFLRLRAGDLEAQRRVTRLR